MKYPLLLRFCWTTPFGIIQNWLIRLIAVDRECKETNKNKTHVINFIHWELAFCDSFITGNYYPIQGIGITRQADRQGKLA